MATIANSNDYDDNNKIYDLLLLWSLLSLSLLPTLLSLSLSSLSSSLLSPLPVGLLLGSQLCGQKSNTLKPARSLFIRGERVRLGGKRVCVDFHKAKVRREGEKERKVASELFGLKGVLLAKNNGGVLNEEMRRKAQGSSSQSEENKDKKDKSKEKDHDDDDRVTTAIGDDLVILRDFELVNLVSDENMLIIDNGATLHVTPRKEFFTSYTAGDFGVLKTSNYGVTKVIGVGDIRDALDAKLLELTKVHTDDNGDDMMTKAVPREKFKACCEIVGLAITST
ncbi:hypothetical protein CR513_02607, partial [Mucuna pruriens]